MTHPNFINQYYASSSGWRNHPQKKSRKVSSKNSKRDLDKTALNE
jgi:hypothetical protein